MMKTHSIRTDDPELFAAPDTEPINYEATSIDDLHKQYDAVPDTVVSKPPTSIYDFTRKPGFYDAKINNCREPDASVNWMDVAARERGWNPLVIGESMTIHYYGKEYVIKRNADMDYEDDDTCPVPSSDTGVADLQAASNVGLLEHIDSQHSTIRELESEIVEKDKRITELEKQLADSIRDMTGMNEDWHTLEEDYKVKLAAAEADAKVAMDIERLHMRVQYDVTEWLTRVSEYQYWNAGNTLRESVALTVKQAETNNQ